jgi:hypothetical protein
MNLDGALSAVQLKKTWLAPSLQAPAIALVALMLPESIQLKVILSEEAGRVFSLYQGRVGGRYQRIFLEDSGHTVGATGK